MAFTIEKSGDITVVDVDGQLIVGNRQELKQTVLDELESGERKFLIDFSKTGYIDSSGLGVLVSLSKKIREHGGDLRLAALNEDLRTLFELTKLDTLFRIADSEKRPSKGCRHRSRRVLVTGVHVDSDLIFHLPSDILEIEEAVERVLCRCETCLEESHKRGKMSRMSMKFRVGLTEALSNAMLYGNGADPSKQVRVEVSVTVMAIVATITDEGDGFDYETVPDPTTPENLLKTDGRGLFLMRNLLDEVRFNERGNSVTLVLRRTTQEARGEMARA